MLKSALFSAKTSNFLKFMVSTRTREAELVLMQTFFGQGRFADESQPCLYISLMS